MSKIRVLVVDDAVVIRRIVSDVLSADPDIEVAGTAANGKIALQKLSQVQPDLVTMDVEMPEMDGLATLKELRKTHPKLPVIMFSTLTARGASATLEALSSGASDYVTKPANVGSVATAMARIREELIPKIKALMGKQVGTPGKPAAASLGSTAGSLALATAGTTIRRPSLNCEIRAVVVAVSTGGPNALAEVIPKLPANLGVPVMIVQHMPPVFTRLLAERLDQKSQVTVKEAVAGDVVQPGHVYIAPGDFHMTVELGGKIALNQNPAENSCRPAADPLFRSASKLYGGAVLGVVLTGMGQDGYRGCEAVREVGGRVIVQDEKTSVVWGMPGVVAAGGLAEEQIPLADVARAIATRVAASVKRAA